MWSIIAVISTCLLWASISNGLKHYRQNKHTKYLKTNLPFWLKDYHKEYSTKYHYFTSSQFNPIDDFKINYLDITYFRKSTDVGIKINFYSNLGTNYFWINFKNMFQVKKLNMPTDFFSALHKRIEDSDEVYILTNEQYLELERNNKKYKVDLLKIMARFRLIEIAPYLILSSNLNELPLKHENNELTINGASLSKFIYREWLTEECIELTYIRLDVLEYISKNMCTDPSVNYENMTIVHKSDLNRKISFTVGSKLTAEQKICHITTAFNRVPDYVIVNNVSNTAAAVCIEDYYLI
jgi:hypothetical protein